MAVQVQPRARTRQLAAPAIRRAGRRFDVPRPNRGWLSIALAALAAWLLMLLGPFSAPAGATAIPRITVHGRRLYAGARPWRAWGLNWGLGDHEPVIAYFDDPTAARLAVLRAELGTARAMGANSMRIYLQLGQVMVSPTRPRQRTLDALRRLLALAQADRIYLDITGDLLWRPSQTPAWYSRLHWRARWRVQATFWRAVAHAAASSPAVLCYELTSEPIVSSTPGYYYGPIGRWWFVQSIATASAAATADTLARRWTRLLANAVRSEDDRPVTIGLLPNTSGPFAPANVAGLLDMLVVHEYPSTGQAKAAISVIRSFAAFHKPVLLGETLLLDDDGPTQAAFLTGAGGYLTGAFEFFDGRDPRTIDVRTIYDAVYQEGLEQFLSLRRLILKG